MAFRFSEGIRFSIGIRWLCITALVIRGEMKCIYSDSRDYRAYGTELCITGRRETSYGVYGAALSIRIREFPFGFIYTVRHPAERKRQG